MSWVNYAVGEWTSHRGFRNALPMQRRCTGRQFEWRNAKTGKVEIHEAVNVRLLYNGKWELPQNVPAHMLYLN